MEKIIEEARNLALSKTTPPKIFLEISEKKALELCKKFKEADKKVVHIGVFMMDIMLSEALSQDKVSEHVNMSIEATQEFLEKHDISAEKKAKIINCVAAHHKNIEFSCIEAEICANADCYRFIHPKGFFYYLTLLNERTKEFSKILDQAEYKLDEKYAILSLQDCKNELEDYYIHLKAYINDSREL